MKFFFKLAVLTCCMCSFLIAKEHQQINLSFDFESAKLLTEILRKNSISDKKLQELIELQGIQSLIKQTARFDNNASESSFIISLKDIVNGNTPDKDPFRLQKVKSQLNEISRLIHRIESNPDYFASELKTMIQTYSTEKLHFKSNVYLVVGGSSDGWATNGNFHAALQFFQEDYEGLKLLMAHELYHVAQPQFYGQAKKSAIQTVSISQALLANTRSEGIASMVGDPLKVNDGLEYVKWFKNKFNKNIKRIDQNVALFETILYRVYNDENFDFMQLYPIGFSGDWDSPLYFVGYYIGQAIEKYKGKEELISLLKEPPSAMFKTYIEIYKNQKNAKLIKFSKSIEEIIFSL